MKYFSEADFADWEEEGFQSEAQYKEYLYLIESNELPIRGDFYSYSSAIKSYSVSPLRESTGYKLHLRGGTPVFSKTEGHAMDSEWQYPVLKTIEVNIIAPESRVSHAAYVAAHPTLHKRIAA